MASPLMQKRHHDRIAIKKVASLNLPVKDEFTRSYPAARRNQLINHIKGRELVRTRREFSGLSDEQRELLLSVIDRNEEIRRRSGLPPGALDESRYADSNDGSNEQVAINPEEMLSSLEYLEQQFPVEQPPIVGEFKYVPPVKQQAEGSIACKPSQKYGKVLDPKPVGGNKLDNVQLDLELQAKQEMKKVSMDLQGWVTDVLDNSMQIDPQVLEQISKLGPQATDEAHKTEYEQTLLALERVDISGFNVLLNACKPSILESKPPVRLNVVNDGSAETVAKKLPNKRKCNSNNPAGRKAEKQNEKAQPTRFNRFLYGTWFMPAAEWNETMKNKDPEVLKAKQTQERRFGGIVQQKLDEINKKRELELEQIMKDVDKTETPDGKHTGKATKATPKKSKK